MRSRRTHAAAAIAALAAALTLSACGVKQETVTSGSRARPFTVALDRPLNATHAALVAASVDGAFAQGGLAVRLLAPASPTQPLQLLEEGRASAAILSEPELLLARDRGEALVSIAALVQQPLAALLALPKGGVGSVAALTGKRVGTDGTDAGTALLGAMLAHAGVDPRTVRTVPIGFEYAPALLRGHVAATFGGFTTYDAPALSMARRTPTVIPVTHAGVPPYAELALVVRAREAEHDGEDLRAFLLALTHGQAQVKADPKAAAALVVKAGGGGPAQLEQASIEGTLPVQAPASSTERYGFQEPAQWESFARWMYAQRLLRTSPATLAQPYTNEFLPGQGP